LDQALLLQKHAPTSWTDADDVGLRAWCEALLQWLGESPIAIEEHNATNNHGIYFDVLVTSVALCLDERDFARDRVSQALTRRIAEQMRPDGGLPHELGRTLSLTYTLLNLGGYCLLAQFGEHVGVDLWNASTPDGRCIARGFAFLTDQLSQPVGWRYEQISPVPATGLPRLLVAAEAGLGASFERDRFAGVLPDDDSQLALFSDESANPLIEMRVDVFEMLAGTPNA